MIIWIAVEEAPMKSVWVPLFFGARDYTLKFLRREDSMKFFR